MKASYQAKQIHTKAVKAVAVAKEKRLGFLENQSKVNMHNALARSRSDLTLNERRLLALGISKLNSMPNRVSGLDVELSALEFGELFGISPKSVYADIKEALMGLNKKPIHVITPAMVADADGKEFYWEGVINWLGHAFYSDGLGKINFSFNAKLKPMLLGLRSHFTSYNIKQISKLHLSYSIRLFEILAGWRGSVSKEYHVSVDDFCELMAVPPSYRHNFAIMRREILTPVLMDLNENAELKVRCEELKTGRKITKLVFHFDWLDALTDQKKAEAKALRAEKRAAKLAKEVEDIPF